MSSTPTFVTKIGMPVDCLPTITLTDDELETCRELAAERNQGYHEIDGGTVKGERSSEGAHDWGIRGEYALAKYYHATDTLDRERYDYGDAGKDLHIAGFAHDVKAVSPDVHMPRDGFKILQKAKHLMSDYSAQHPSDYVSADMYSLVVFLDERTAQLWGYCTREQLLDREPECYPYDDVPNFVVDAADLYAPPPRHKIEE